MSLPIVLILYILSAGILVYSSIKCADYVDLLDKKTNMSGAFIGGVVLAAVTSLPEFVTSLSSIFVVKNPELIVGNVLGSNIFNLCIFGGLTLIYARGFLKSTVGKAHIATMICTLVAYAATAVVFWNPPQFGQIPFINANVASFAILIVYFVSFRFLSSDDTDNEEEDTSPLTVKQIVIRFVMMAMVLVVMSVAVTALTDELQAQLRLDASLAGAIFLGVATSLPELSSSIALVRHRNYNAMLGNVVGSNMFNFTIFSVADIISGQAIYPNAATVSAETKNMLVFGVLSTLLVMTSVLLQRRDKRRKESAPAMILVACGIGALVLVSYVVSLVLPFSVF